MNSTLALTKILIKNRLYALFGPRKKEKSKKSSIGAIIFVIVIFLLAYPSFFSFAYPMGKLAKEGDFVDSFAIIVAPILGILVFIVCLTFVFSTFFQATDNEMWLHLPLKPSQIFTARFLANVFNVYIIELVLVVPFRLAYSIGAKLDAFAIFGQIFYVLFLPFLIVSIIFMLGALIAKIVNIRSHKKLFNAISIILIIIFTVGIVIFSSFGGQVFGNALGDVGTEAGEEVLANLKDSVESTANSLSWSIPFSYFIIPMFIGGLKGILFPLVFVVISLIFTFFAFLVAKPTYNSVLQSEAQYKKKGKKKEKTDVVIKKRPAISSLIAREFKTIFRSSTYFLNLLFPAFINIIVILFTIFAPMFSLTAEEYNPLDAFRILFTTETGAGIFIALSIAALFCMTIGISVTAFSREGQNAGLLKTLPISPMKLFIVKLLPGIIVSSLVYFVILTVSAFIVFPMFYVYLILLVFGLIHIIIANIFALLYDLHRPFTNWSEETQAVKQNKNVFINVVLGFVFLIGYGLLIGLTLSLKLNFWYSALIYIAISLILLIPTLLMIKSKGPALFDNIT